MSVSTFPSRAQQPLVLPAPQALHRGEGELLVDANFRCQVRGGAAGQLRPALQRFFDRLSQRSGLSLDARPVESCARLRIHCRDADPEGAVPGLCDDESYTLVVDPSSGVELAASQRVGILHGLETLLQLLEARGHEQVLPALVIEDHPRFPWRGLMLDCVGSYLPLATLEREVEAMARVKLKVLHLRLGGAAGFRIQSHRYPALHELEDEPGPYQQAQLCELVAFAAERGVRVVPEIQLPAVLEYGARAFPSLAGGPPGAPEVQDFCGGLLREVMPLFADEYLHLGGPADGPDCAGLWASLQPILAEQGKKLMAGEGLLPGSAGAPRYAGEVMMQATSGPASLRVMAELGQDCVRSEGFELGDLRSAAAHYHWDPLAGLAAVDRSSLVHVLGAEASLAAARIDGANLDSRLWPRCGAIAERLWSPAERRDVEDLYRRLDPLNRDLEDAGLSPLRAARVHVEQLTGGLCQPAVQTLVDVLGPAGIGADADHAEGRGVGIRLADCLPAESLVAQRFSLAVQGYLAGGDARPRHRRDILRLAGVWADNHVHLLRETSGRRPGTELLRHSAGLSQMAQLALTAMDCLHQGEVAHRSWVDEATAKLIEAEAVLDGLSLQISAPVRWLVQAAAAEPFCR